LSQGHALEIAPTGKLSGSAEIISLASVDYLVRGSFRLTGKKVSAEPVIGTTEHPPGWGSVNAAIRALGVDDAHIRPLRQHRRHRLFAAQAPLFAVLVKRLAGSVLTVVGILPHVNIVLLVVVDDAVQSGVTADFGEGDEVGLGACPIVERVGHARVADHDGSIIMSDLGQRALYRANLAVKFVVVRRVVWPKAILIVGIFQNQTIKR